MTRATSAALVAAAGLTATVVLSSRDVHSQVQGTLPGFVRIQPTSPGTPQTGHSNITGTAIAGSFEGSGAGLTNLDAGNIVNGVLPPARGGLGFDASNPPLGSLLAGTGTDWALVPPGNEGSVLTLVGGSPAWTPGAGSLNLPYSGNGDDGGLDGLFSVQNAGANSAVMGVASHPLGIGVRGVATDATNYSYGGHFTASGPNARALFAQNSSVTGSAVAGRFGSASPDSTVVYVSATASTGDATALYGESSADSGNGVTGVATSTVANRFSVGVEGRASANDGVGVFGYNASPSGRSTGVYAGSANINSGAWALLVLGNSITVGTKQFAIDHPLDPENKILHHYCSEGPAPYNVYKGRVQTDARGLAWARLPDYFEAVNKDPDYQLTVIDGSDEFVLAKVTREVRDGQFQIRTSKPGVTVCWEVRAVRNDRWVRQGGYGDVEVKQPAEKGKYLVPQLYGQPPTRGIRHSGQDSAGRERPEPARP